MYRIRVGKHFCTKPYYADSPTDPRFPLAAKVLIAADVPVDAKDVEGQTDSLATLGES